MIKIDTLIEENWNIIKLILLILPLVGGYVAFDDYISNQIEKQITSASYIEKLSKSLRPFLIFNGNGIIVYDHGGADIIKSIEIYDKEDTINVQFNKFIKDAPLLMVVGANQYTYKAERGKNFSWVFKNITKTELLVYEPPQKEDLKFLMEILK